MTDKKIGKKKRVIKIFEYVGQFAEDKDIAKKIRVDVLWTSFEQNIEVILDFDRVNDATQSFIHALISQLIRETQGEILDFVYFRNCNTTVKEIINMVVDYMLEAN